MSGKFTFVDYEPLTRSGRKDGHADDSDEGVTRSASRVDQSKQFSQSPQGAGQAHFTDRWPEKSEKSVENGSAPVANTESWILKRGHSVSYAGLFLFTFLVFARPYELFPSLSWLSNSAFWVAIFTLVVFVPIQLGLENRITVKQREVGLVLSLVVIGLLSIIFALDRLRAWNSFLDYLKVVLMFIVAVNVVRTENRLKWDLVIGFGDHLSLEFECDK